MAMNEWTLAASPNYARNVNKMYPYSEVPYIGQYKLLKIPLGSNLIELVDYWGEGRQVSEAGVSGFPDCYNINHPSQTVSNGTDKGRKIPNRVPVKSYTDCNTSSYIRDNSVKTVTLMGAPINSSCAADIARMINEEHGRVIVFGFEDDSLYINNLKTELQSKHFIRCDGYNLPDALRGLTLFEPIRDFSALKVTLRKLIVDSNYDLAVELSKQLFFGDYANVIRQVVSELINERNNNLMNFAYKLCVNDGQRVVAKYFPVQFKLIFNEEDVTIINKKFHLALKLAHALDSDNDRMVWGDATDRSSYRVKWRFIPLWIDEAVCFQIMNICCGMFMKLATYTDKYQNREVWGCFKCTYYARSAWYLDPVMLNGELLFFIRNKEYNRVLKLAKTPHPPGDRQAWSNHSAVNDPGYFGWYISSWK